LAKQFVIIRLSKKNRKQHWWIKWTENKKTFLSW